jgi:hypothetical protein
MIVTTLPKSRLIKTVADFYTAKEAQEYMLDQLKKYPPHTYDTSLSAIRKVTPDGLFFTVFCARSASPLWKI